MNLADDARTLADEALRAKYGTEPRCDHCSWWRDKNAEILMPDGKSYVRLGDCHVDNLQRQTRADWWCSNHSELPRNSAMWMAQSTGGPAIVVPPEDYVETPPHGGPPKTMQESIDAEARYEAAWKAHPEAPRPVTRTHDGDEKLPPFLGDPNMPPAYRRREPGIAQWPQADGGASEEPAGCSDDDEGDEEIGLLNPDPTHTEPPKDTQGDEMGNP